MVNQFLLAAIPIIGIILGYFIYKRNSMVHFFEQVVSVTKHQIRMIDIYANKGIKLSTIVTNLEIILFIGSIFLTKINGSWGMIYKGLVYAALLDMLLIFIELACFYTINYYTYLVKRTAKENGIEIQKG